MVLYKYYLGFSPSLINSAILLAREGYEVHIFIAKSSFDAARINLHMENIVIHPIEIRQEEEHEPKHLSFWMNFWNKIIFEFSKTGKFRRLKISNSLIGTIYRELISLVYKTLYRRGPFIDRLYHNISLFFPNIFEYYQRILDYIDNDYICIIGVDTAGLLISTLVMESFSEKKKIPIIYSNMELLLDSEVCSLRDKIKKSLERECNRMCYTTIIQDKRRAKYLMKDNNIPEEKITLVPVSGLREIYENKSNYLQKSLGIDEDKKIIIQAGGLTNWSRSLEIAEVAQKWNEKMVVVMHNCRADLKNHPYTNQIKKLTKNKKVYLSLNPVEWEVLPELLSSADIGLIFYKNLSKNFYETGSSSNKIVQYLQVGLPIITIDFPSFKEVIDEYRCGECAKSPEEIEELANKIFLKYSTYSANAFRCYETKYKFSNYFKTVINKIRELE